MNEIKRHRIWETRYSFGDAERDGGVASIAKELGVSPLFAVLLYNRGYVTPEASRSFLHFEETDFHDPFLMADMDKAVKRILEAVDKKEKIYIYGDYDVDGVTSVSMLYLYLCGLGCDVGVKIPRRDDEGYGVSRTALEAIASDGASLIITVDTGITAYDEVEYARELGVDFVITDHHECHGKLPLACAVVNPHRPDCTYPFCELAGVGVVFKVLCACEMYREMLSGGEKIDGARRICREYSDLVSVGTIADVMPLVDENRLIVSLGLAKLSRGEGRRGLQALLDVSGKRGEDMKRKNVTSSMVGFGIAPRINAAGRISDALIAVCLLLAEGDDEARAYAEQLCEINRQRQTQENVIATDAYKMIEENPSFCNDRVIILENDNWQQGIIGIVSSRITDRYGLPSILVSYRGSYEGEASPNDDGKGSGRSIKGLNLVEALGACEDLLVKYGGHELAAGLTVKRGRLEDFRRRINEYASEHMTEDMFKVRIEADCELLPSDISMSFADEIVSLEPFGIGNPTPAFLLCDAVIKKITYIGAGKHTKLLLECGESIITAMCFGIGENIFGYDIGDKVDILFNLDINDYRGQRSVQLIVQDIRDAESDTQSFELERKRYKQICDGDTYTSSECVIPERGDFARVYSCLRKAFRTGCEKMRTAAILRAVNDGEASKIGYIKLQIILKVFNELQICSVEKIGDELYRLDIFFNANKTNIEKSSILKKLRTQCIKE